MVWGILKLPRPLKRLSRALLSWLPLMACVLHVVLSMSRGYALYKGNLGNLSCQSTCDVCIPQLLSKLQSYWSIFNTQVYTHICAVAITMPQFNPIKP